MGVTSTGHELSDAPWLDVHFESARAEYEEASHFVGILPGWTVLDAGCGSGGYVPLICEHVGPTGGVAALDLAPENVAHVERLVRDGHCAAPVDVQVGSVLDLPFADATFDCVWCANVAQYFTKTEFARVMGEFRRVAKPGGLVAVKEFDATLFQFLPLDPAIQARLIAARRAKMADTGLLGIWCGPLLGSFFREAGLTDLVRRSWLVERWAPLQPSTRQLVTMLIRRQAGLAPEFAVPSADIPSADQEALRAAAEDPDRLLGDPDFCFREAFVVTLGRVPA
jgi:ubiquinone/menaquinone biosynthesis C-methylase UbiE